QEDGRRGGDAGVARRDGAARHPAAAGHRQLPGAVLADLDSRRAAVGDGPAGRAPAGRQSDPGGHRRPRGEGGCRSERREPGSRAGRLGCARSTQFRRDASMTPPTLETARVATDAVVVGLARERRRVAADLVALTKPRVVLMVLVTTVVGY